MRHMYRSSVTIRRLALIAGIGEETVTRNINDILESFAELDHEK